MTVVRFKNRPNGAVSFNNLLSDVFPQTPSLYRDDFKQAIPVNIKETEKEYVLEVVAPGMKKEDFKVELNNNMLTISSEKRDEQEENNNEGRFNRREFSYQSFQRSFQLAKDVVDADNIQAKYENGLLHLLIPKREEVKPKPARLIQIN